MLECRDGTAVYFVKMVEEDNNIVGVMLVLDERHNLIELKKDVDLVSIYEGGNTEIKFVFVKHKE